MLHAFPGTLGTQRQSLGRLANQQFANITVAAGTPLGTYGASWTEAVTSTPFDVTGIRLHNTTTLANSAARSDYAIAVGKGAAGSEQQIIGPLMFGARPVLSSYAIPCFVPAGTRLSLRTAAGVASRSMTFTIDLYGGPNRDIGSLPTGWVAYGTNMGSGVGAYGTHVTAGNAVFGSWTSIGTATRAHDLWLPMVAIGTSTSLSAVSWRTQVAVASTTDAATMATNLTGIIEPFQLTGSSVESLGGYNVATNSVIVGYNDILYAPRDAGQALSARALCSAAPDTNGISIAMLAAVK